MKKALQIAKYVSSYIVAIAAVAMVIFTLTAVYALNKTDRSLFDLKFFVVVTDSMKADGFSSGDVVITRSVDPEELKPNDIITFLSNDPYSFGQTITHKIRRATTDEKGNPGFITYGTTTDQDDRTVVTYEHIIGKYQGYIPKLGTFFAYLKTPAGYLSCILIPFLLLLFLLALDCIRLFRQYKKEQIDEITAEKEKIQEEYEKLFEELQILKSQDIQEVSPKTIVGPLVQQAVESNEDDT